MIRAGVIGSPARHSLSPAIHNAWLRAAGIDGHYGLYDIGPDQFVETVAALRAEGLAGLNVTLPFKEEALELAEEASAEALPAGAANVLVFWQGRALARNTDGLGVLEALSPHLGGFAQPKTVVVLGAGGAAAGAVLALTGRGAKVRLVNRTRQRADALAARFADQAVAYDWQALELALDGADALINATSLGLEGRDPLTVALDALPRAAPVMDMVYKPLRTAFLKAAERRGHLTVDGLDMLIGQARPSFEAFFGQSPPADLDVRVLALAELERRA